MNKPKAEIYAHPGGDFNLYLNDKGIKIALTPEELRDVSKFVLLLVGVAETDLHPKTQEWLKKEGN